MDNQNLDSRLEASLDKLIQTDYEEVLPNFSIFGLQLRPNKIVYIFQINSDFENRLNIFLNDDQFTTFEKHVKSPKTNNRLKQAESFFSQDYISIQMPGFPDDDLDEYAGPFQRYYPHQLPERVSGEEAEEIVQVLDMLTDLTKSHIRHEKYLYQELPVINGRGVIPLVKPKNKGYVVDQIAINLDITKEEEYKDLIFEDEILLSKLKQNSYKGNFALEFIYGSVPLIVTEVGPEPFFLNGMLVYDYFTECMEPIGCRHSYLDEPEEFLHDFAEDLLTFELLPYEVHIRDKKTLSIVKDLFEKLNVTVIFEDEIPELDTVEDEIFDIEHNQQEMTQEDVDELGKVLNDIIDMDLPFSKRLVNNYYKFSEDFNNEDKENNQEEIVDNVIELNDIRSVEYKASVKDFGEFRIVAPITETIEGLIYYLLDNIGYQKLYPEWKDDASFDSDLIFELMESVPKKVGKKFEHSMDTNDDLGVKLEIISTSPEIVKEITIESLD